MDFDNCTQAYNAGYANILKGDPHYVAKLDRDKDGIACERPPAGSETSPPTQTSTTVPTAPGTGNQLPTTGPAIGFAVGGLALLLLGIVTLVLFRRRRDRFTA
jgi:LPXTG-motif cell wall-anchored protein